MQAPLFCDKENVNVLTALLVSHGVRDVVVCPGSRNAALVHDFHVCPDLRCHPVTDERSAAFVAIGLIEATRGTVAVCVTSGSALLGVKPAAAEAFYRRLPLLVISADRPPEWIGQLDGQTLPQPGALHPFAPSFVLPEIHNETTRWHAIRTANEALLAAQRGQPVHLNVPLSEPLFNFTVSNLPPVRAISEIKPTASHPLPEAWMDRIRAARLPVLVIGQYEDEPLEALPAIEDTDGLLVLPELLAGVQGAWRTAVLEHSPETLKGLRPDLVIHAGGNLVHKRLKLHLRQLPECPVLRIEEGHGLPDTFRHLEAVLRAPLPAVLRQLAEAGEAKPEVKDWKTRLENARGCLECPKDLNNNTPTPNSPLSTLLSPLSTKRKLSTLHSQLTPTSLQVVQACCQRLEQATGISLHLGNSMAVRLAARFLAGGAFPVHCNRGVNGIEGSLSAAVGHSLAFAGLTVALLGDLSFFYDQNALWNERLNGRLRILVLNNGGGGIFHHLPGLDASAALHGPIDGAHRCTTAGVAETFGLRRREIRQPADIGPALDFLLAPQADCPVLVEAFTAL